MTTNKFLTPEEEAAALGAKFFSKTNWQDRDGNLCPSACVARVRDPSLETERVDAFIARNKSKAILNKALCDTAAHFGFCCAYCFGSEMAGGRDPFGKFRKGER